MDLISFSDFLSPEDFEMAVQMTLHSRDWHFGRKSTLDDKVAFWDIALTDTPFFSEHVASIIRHKTGLDFDIDSIDANGQTYGLSGIVHRDRYPEEGDNFVTFLLYTHPYWQLVWGGYTVLYDEKTGEEVYIPPKPNFAIMFDSTIPHVGLEPTRHCTELRVSVAYKLRLK